MNTSRLRGSLTPLVTPFRDGAVDEEAQGVGTRGAAEVWSAARGS
jgi:hypothetical protein